MCRMEYLFKIDLSPGLQNAEAQVNKELNLEFAGMDVRVSTNKGSGSGSDSNQIIMDMDKHKQQ